MTMRLSISSLAGNARTLVAVGTERLATMFCAVRAAAPRSLASSASAGGGVARCWACGACGATGALGAAGVLGLAGLLGALGAGAGGGATRVSPELPAVMAGCGPVPFPRVGR